MAVILTLIKFILILTLLQSVALLPVFLYAVLHAQNYTKQILNVSWTWIFLWHSCSILVSRSVNRCELLYWVQSIWQEGESEGGNCPSNKKYWVESTFLSF